MSTIGLVYSAANSASGNGGAEQAMLLRTLQDNERNAIGARFCLAASQEQPAAAAKNNNVSVISLAASEPLDASCKGSAQALPAYDPSRLKKHGKNGQPPPIAVAKRNARERNRVKQVNNGFATLRQHIPSHVAQGYGDRGKKLSKVETLRMAVEYIRGLQRLLAEADHGLDGLDGKLGGASSEPRVTVPSPTGSLYSSSTHNGSAEVFGLDAEHQRDDDFLDEDDDMDEEQQQQQHHHHYQADDEMRLMGGEPKGRRPAKRSRDEPRIKTASRLSENQNRERCRRREDNYYKQSSSFGDEENIEPLSNRNKENQSKNNNNNSLNNNNHLLGSFSPILVQSTASAANNSLSCIKREVVQLLDEDEGRRLSEDEVQRSASEGVILASSSSSPYAGEIFIESPETGRLVPLKLEEHEAQLVYVSAAEPASSFYRAELPDSAAELSWWEQECIVQQMQQQPSAQTPAQRPLAPV